MLFVPQIATADLYQLDSGNTQVSLYLHRFGITWVTVHFSDISGALVLSSQSSSSTVEVGVATASVHSNWPGWSERLRSADWLDAARYPRLSFHAEHLEIGATQVAATGELTLHGVTRPIMFEVSFVGCRAASVCRFVARGQARRSEFGLPHEFWTGGDAVEFAISGAALATPPK